MQRTCTSGGKTSGTKRSGRKVDLIKRPKSGRSGTEPGKGGPRIKLEFTNVYADISGTINILTIKVGESFSPGTNIPPDRNTDNMKVTVSVPELYQVRIHVGTPVKIAFPGLNRKLPARSGSSEK